MRRPASLAEYYREHREAFELALELDTTPAEALGELRRRKAVAEDRIATARLEAAMAAPCPTLAYACEAPERPVPWWQRD